MAGGNGRPAVSLFWRVFAANAAVFTVATLILALTPATVSFPVALEEAIVLVGGLAAILIANVYLLRVSLAPLRRLAELMEKIDLLRPTERLPISGGGEVAEVIETFNEMLDRLEAERRVSTGRALAAQEAERRRVAQELHDEIGQGLTAVLLELKRVSANAPPELCDELADAQELARQSLDEVRRIARRLRPGVLDDLGLKNALASLAVSFSERTGVRVRRRFDPGLPPLSRDAELTLYRIAQESLTNVARHAGATRVELSLTRRDGAVSLRVADDGRGLAGAVEDGNGIRGMRERAILVGAELAIESQPGRGVEVRLDVPASENAG